MIEKYTSFSVKRGRRGLMAQACIAAAGTDSLILIDDVTPDGSRRMNSEVYRNSLSAKTHCQHNEGLHQGKKWEVSRLIKSITQMD